MNLAVKIYLIDDDDLFSFLISEYLKESKKEITLTKYSSGTSALHQLRQSIDHAELLPDIIFLDLNMPIMDGWEFIDEFEVIRKKLNNTIKLYVFSSTISPVDIERAKEIKTITEFIIKPASAEKINSIIQDY